MYAYHLTLTKCDRHGVPCAVQRWEGPCTARWIYFTTAAGDRFIIDQDDLPDTAVKYVPETNSEGGAYPVLDTDRLGRFLEAWVLDHWKLLHTA